jgi:transporter family protein
MNDQTRPLLFSLLTILMWGLWGFFGKLALEKRMAPTTVFVAETLVSALIAVPLFLAVIQRQGAQPFHSSVNVYGILSGAALAFGLLFYYLALEGASVSVVVPLTATYPVVAALLAYAALGERPSLAQWLGVALVIAGAVLLLSGPAKVSAP